MALRRMNTCTRSASVGRHQSPRYNSNDSDNDSSSRTDSFPNVLPELTKLIRKLLPQELPLNTHVRNVDFTENGCERLSGTLYLTIFRLVFAPDNEMENNNLITSGNKYIGDYDIPLKSIYKINVAPVDSRSGFKSFLNENQIQSETRTFTILTRDFRSITFSKCSVIKSNSLSIKPQLSTTKMETYIDELKIHSRIRNKEQLYPYLVVQKLAVNNLYPRIQRGYSVSSSMSVSGGRSIDDDIEDFCTSNDKRIRSYMTFRDWIDELADANEEQWIVEQKKFDKEHVIREDGPFVRFTHANDNNGVDDLIWHWTHTSEVEQHKRKAKQYMLVTVLGIAESAGAGDPVESQTGILTASLLPLCFLNISKKLSKTIIPNHTDGPPVICTNENKTAIGGLMIVPPKSPSVGLRRNTTDSGLTHSCHYVNEQPFQRYNLARFPCQLKRLQVSYEKLIEICVTASDNDDDKWLTKLNTCKWLKYVSKALHGAASLAKLLNYKDIELAGSDKDNSCLMSSLIQIFLRPKCRTIKGFCELIVREWLMRGHPFCERFGQVLSDADGYSAQEAPVFLLFLDCVHQLITQNPFSFEFTDYLLIELYHDVCYCYQHTFAFNSVLDRLQAITNCPKNLLVLSSFDFSLYLYPNAYRLLKNDTSVFTSSRQQSSKDNPSSKRTTYRLETPKPINFVLDISSATESQASNAEQFEYDIIESPQKFGSDFHIDWRIYNIVLWSKCYCRYDQNYMPTSHEQLLLNEINYLQEAVQNVRIKSRRYMTIDSLHSIKHANSWHPQMLDTHV